MLGFAVTLLCFPLLCCVSNAKFLMICLALPLHCVFLCYVVGLRSSFLSYALLCCYIVVFFFAMLCV